MREEAGRIGEMINGTWRFRMLGVCLLFVGIVLINNGVCALCKGTGYQGSLTKA